MAKLIKTYGYDIYCGKTRQFCILAYIVDRCNYNCYYCYNHLPRYGEMLDLGKLAEFTYRIKNMFPDRKLVLDLIGGETTLHPDLETFCLRMSRLENIQITVYTNFSKTADYYNNLMKIGVNFIITWHGGCDSEEFKRRFAELDQRLVEKYVDLVIMCENRNPEKSLEIFDFFKRAYPNIQHLQIQRLDVNQNFKDNSYSAIVDAEIQRRETLTKTRATVLEYDDGSRRIVDDNYFFSNQRQKNFKFWKCNAGADFIYVHFNGDVHPCDENDRTILFNICQDKEIRLRENGIFCMRDSCPCLFDIYKERVFEK